MTYNNYKNEFIYLDVKYPNYYHRIVIREVAARQIIIENIVN